MVTLLLAVLLVGAAAWFLATGDEASDDKPAAPTGRQRTLLVQVVDGDRQAVASALLGVDSAGRKGAAVLIPSRLLVDVDGAGATSFGELLSETDPGASSNALSDLLGVRVDGAWVLTEAGLAALADRVGGVHADVDVDVVTVDEEGARTLVVQAGAQELSGRAAAAYATYVGEDEPELVKLARFEEVLTGVLRRLPARHAELAVALATLQNEARSTLPVRELEQTVDALRRAAAADRLFADVLPVEDVPIEGKETAYEVDAAPAQELLELGFARSLLKP